MGCLFAFAGGEEKPQTHIRRVAFNNGKGTCDYCNGWRVLGERGFALLTAFSPSDVSPLGIWGSGRSACRPSA